TIFSRASFTVILRLACWPARSRSSAGPPSPSGAGMVKVSAWSCAATGTPMSAWASPGIASPCSVEPTSPSRTFDPSSTIPDARAVGEALPLVELQLVDHRLHDRHDAVLLHRLGVALLHEPLLHLALHLPREHLFEHGARHLALAEPLEGDALAQLAVRLVE